MTLQISQRNPEALKGPPDRDPKRLLKDPWETPKNSWETPKRLLWDSCKTPKRLLRNSEETPKRILRDFCDNLDNLGRLYLNSKILLKDFWDTPLILLRVSKRLLKNSNDLEMTCIWLEHRLYKTCIWQEMTYRWDAKTFTCFWLIFWENEWQQQQQQKNW